VKELCQHKEQRLEEFVSHLESKKERYKQQRRKQSIEDQLHFKKMVSRKSENYWDTLIVQEREKAKKQGLSKKTTDSLVSVDVTPAARSPKGKSP
jgi:hypothetical protein